MNDFDQGDFDRLATRAVDAAGLRGVVWVVDVHDRDRSPHVLRGILPCEKARDEPSPMLRICHPRRFGEPQWVSLSYMDQGWARTGRPCADIEASVRWILTRLARDARLAARHETFRRVIARDVWAGIRASHMLPDAWRQIDEEGKRWVENRPPAANELRTDLTAAREAIRVLLGDAGLDGLGDLTTADGRSVVGIVRRGMGVVT